MGRGDDRGRFGTPDRELHWDDADRNPGRKLPDGRGQHAHPRLTPQRAERRDLDRPSNQGDYDEAPVHKVTISQPFRIAATEVTIQQYRQFRPRYRENPYHAPYAAGVSWNDAAAFCEWVTRKEGKPYRLPTEAEWDTTCRVAARPLSSSGPLPPAAEAANAWGVKNMHTGVAEWVLDWHGMYPRGPETDPVGPAHGIARVIRSGGLDYKPAPKTDGGKPAGRNALLRALGESRHHGPRVRQSRTTNRIPRGAGGAAEDRAAAVRDAVRAQLGEADRARLRSEERRVGKECRSR